MARGIVGSAFIAIRPDTKGFEASARAGIVGPLKKIAIAGAAAFAAAGIGRTIAKAVTSAADFEQSLNLLKATSGATAKQMKAISDLSIKLGADIHLPATSAKDAADAMLELARGGLTVQQTMAAARGVLVLSTAAQIDNASAAKITANALQAFGLAGKRAADVANLLAGAANQSTAEIPDMADALQQSATVAHQYGVSIEQTVAALTEFANAGIKGQDAGTSFKRFLQLLLPTAKPAREEIERLGVSVKDAHGGFLPLPNIIDQFRKGLAKLGPVQRQQALNTVFGSDATRAANILFGRSGEALDKLTRAVNKKGQADKLARAQTSGFNGALSALRSNVETLGIRIGTALLPSLSKAARKLSSFVGDISGAKSFRAVIGITLSGLDAARKTVQDFLLGKDTKQHVIGGGLGKRTIHVEGLGEQVAGSIRDEFNKVNWTAVGKTVGDKIGASIKISVDKLDTILDSILTWANQNAGKIGNVGAVIAANLVSTLLDPSFWAQHWELGLAIALSVLPVGRLVKIGESMVGFIVKPFASLLGPLIGDALRGGAIGLAVAADHLGSSVGDLIGSAIRKGGRGLVDIVSVLLKPLGALGTGIADLVGRGVEGAAGLVERTASKLGVAVASGISGSVSAVAKAASSLAGKAADAISKGWHDLPGLVRAALKIGILDTIIRAAASAVSAAVDLAGRVVSAVGGGLRALPGIVGRFLAQSVAAFVGDVGKFGQGAERIATAIAKGIKTAPGKLAGLAGDILGKLKSIASELAGDAFDAMLGVGKAIIEGIKAGITSAAGSLKGFVESAVHKAIGISISPITVPIKIATSVAGAVPGRHARGGFIPGDPNTGDSVPALLTPGEVVLNPRQQAAVGMGRIMGALRFANGGVVPNPLIATAAASSSTTGTSTAQAADNAKRAGVKIGEALLLGYLQGTRDLPDKIRDSLKNAIDRLKGVVEARRDVLATAFGEAGDKAFAAFDAATQRGLGGISKQFEKLSANFQTFFQGLGDTAEAGLGEGLAAKIGHDLAVKMGPAFDKLSQTAKDALVNSGIEQFAGDVGDAFTNLPANVRANLLKGGDALKSAFDADMQAIEDTFSKTTDSINNTLQAELDQIDRDTQSTIDTINSSLDAQLDAIEKKRQALTPTEALLGDEQKAHDAAAAAKELAAAQQAVADAQTELNDAQAAGDDAGILAGQKTLADAQAALAEQVYQQQIALQQTQADAERKARDDQAAADEAAARDQAAREILAANDLAAQRAANDQNNAAIALAAAQAQHDQAAAAKQAGYDADQAALDLAHDRIVASIDVQTDRQTAALEAQQNREEIEYQASRDLLREHFAKRLAAIEAATEREKDGWQNHHAQIMKLLHSIVGDYQEAGSNLGQAFVQGLNESTGALEGAAEKLAAAIAKYLKLHSPAEKGPLSSLDKWWEPFAPTLMKGLDTSSLAAATRGLAPGRPGVSSYGAVGDPRLLRKLDEVVAAVREHRDGDLTIVAGSRGLNLDEIAARAGG